MRTLISILRAIAEPTRLRILSVCAEGELAVGELAQILGQTQPRVSRHLKVLTEADVLERAPEGNWVFYRLKSEGLGAAVAGVLVGLMSESDPESILDRRRLAAVKADRHAKAEGYFRRNAREWNALHALGVDEAQIEEQIRAALADRPIGDFLDVGTGTGRMLELLGGAAHHAVGVDLSADMLNVARANLDRAGLTRCSLRKADMYQLPFADRSFDTVAIHQVLHYADDPAMAIAEAARALRPKGRLLIADFAPHDIESLRTEHQHRRLGFSDDEVQTWLRSAGMATTTTRRLHGDLLTVVLWLATLGPAASFPSLAAVRPQAEVHP